MHTSLLVAFFFFKIICIILGIINSLDFRLKRWSRPVVLYILCIRHQLYILNRKQCNLIDDECSAPDSSNTTIYVLLKSLRWPLFLLFVFLMTTICLTSETRCLQSNWKLPVCDKAGLHTIFHWSSTKYSKLSLFFPKLIKVNYKKILSFEKLQFINCGLRFTVWWAEKDIPSQI